MTREAQIARLQTSLILDANIMDAEDMIAMYQRWNNHTEALRWTIIFLILDAIEA